MSTRASVHPPHINGRGWELLVGQMHLGFTVRETLPFSILPRTTVRCIMDGRCVKYSNILIPRSEN